MIRSPRNIKIKVCGMRDADNISAIASLHPDYMGFIFYPQSSRFAGNINPEVFALLPDSIKRTGVFVDADLDEIKIRIKNFKLRAVQLHGNESPEFCKEVQKLGVELIKAFGIDESFDFNDLEKYKDAADYFLFDTKTPKHGGSGTLFNWELLNQNNTNKPYFLSGGIDEKQVSDISNLTDMRLYAIDVNSKFELSPGIKDVNKLKLIL